MRALLVSLLLAAVVPVFSGCGTGVVEPDPAGDDDDDDDPVELDPCEAQADCALVEVCVDGLCHAACSEDQPCLGDRRVCDEGACVACLLDEHCAEDETCNDANECEGAPTTECTPNEVGCLDEDTAFVCSGDGSERLEAPCREDQFCEEGVCRTLVCTPSSVVCSGNARLICDASGTDTTVETCDDACDDGGFGCTCVEGAETASCEPRTCAPGEARCVGNAAQRCDADGLSFGDLEDCAQDSCISGTCLPDACTPGTASCSGRVLLQCDGDGQGYDESTCEQTCVESGETAACADQVCVPFAQECSDAETLSVCNANGTDEVSQPCGANKFCEDGVCQSEVCTPNARTCIGDAAAVCNALGSDETVTPCDAGDTCEAGQCVDAACVPQCSDRECGPDPLCGASCGSCAGTCSSDGECIGAGAGPLLVVELSWTPTAQDMDLYLTRDPDGVMCIDDACSVHTCLAGDVGRPDWNDDGVAGGGDPLLVDGPSENPERIELQLSSLALPDLRVGADNFGPVSSSGTAATTTATIRLRLDGALVATHSRSVPVGANWKGVSIAWDGSELTSTDLETIAADFECSAPAGLSCTTDSDCPQGEGCVSDGLFSGTCGAVDCVSDAECGGFLVCNGVHQCALPLLAGWKGDCRNGDGNTDNGNCHVGFHCDFFTAVCEEACATTAGAGVSTSCAGIDNCCEASGGDTCTADLLFGITGNCNP